MIKSITKSSDDYHEKYIKIKLNLDNELEMVMIEIPSMIIVVGAVFHESNKYYPQVLINECLYKIEIT